jgi:hypothetical protein
MSQTRVQKLMTAESLIRDALADAQPLDGSELATVREIDFITRRRIWDSLKGGGR